MCLNKKIANDAQKLGYVPCKIIRVGQPKVIIISVFDTAKAFCKVRGKRLNCIFVFVFSFF